MPALSLIDPGSSRVNAFKAVTVSLQRWVGFRDSSFLSILIGVSEVVAEAVDIIKLESELRGLYRRQEMDVI